jgi:hypothetical protein
MTKRKVRGKTDAERYCIIYRREVGDLRAILAAAARGVYRLDRDPYGRPLLSLPGHIARIEARIAELESLSE